MKSLLCAGVPLLLASTLSASDIHLTVESAGQSSISVNPGANIVYKVRGELSDQLNEGLAGFTFDLTFDGGPIAPAAAPGSSPMNGFAPPLGLSNPAGYGGTPVGGDLIQVGGMQNTIGNFLAIPPNGSVITGVAWPGASKSLVTGVLKAPMFPGNYTLSLTNPHANVIRMGESGVPFWACDEAGIGTVTHLAIEVKEVFSSDVTELSIASGDTQTMTLTAGAANAGRAYFVLGSVTGTTPGLPLGPVHLPLNFDFYMNLTLSSPNAFPLTDSLGLLNGSGGGTTLFTMPTGLSPGLVGVEISHAYLLVAPEDFASNPVTIEIVL